MNRVAHVLWFLSIALSLRVSDGVAGPCEELSVQVRSACCAPANPPDAGQAGIDGMTLENFTYTDASGVAHTIPCRRMSNARGWRPGERPAPLPAALNCEQSQVLYQQQGCAREVDLCGQGPGRVGDGDVPHQEAQLPPARVGQADSRVVVAPACETLEGYASLFGGDITDPLRLAYLKAIYQGQPGLLPNAGPDAVDDRTNGRPVALPGQEQAPREPGPRQRPVPDARGLDAREVTPLRLELPGNTLRYLMRSLGLVPLMQTLDNPQNVIEGLRARGELSAADETLLQQLELIQDAVSCNQETLTCEINPWRSQAVRQALDQVENLVNARNVGRLRIMTEHRPDHNREGFDMVGVLFETNNIVGNSGKVRVAWEGRFQIRPHRVGGTDRIFRFTFGPPSTFRLLPAHDPDRSNNYNLSSAILDRRGNYLDRAALVTQLSDPTCRELRQLMPGETEWNKNPLTCNCDGGSSRNYCVFDPFPRPDSQPALANRDTLRAVETRLTGSPGGVQLWDITCSDPFWVNTSPNDRAGTDRETRASLNSLFPGANVRFMNGLKSALRLTGCGGIKSELFSMVPPVQQGERTLGRYTASSAGLSLFLPQVGLGSFALGFDRGLHVGSLDGGAALGAIADNPAMGGEGLGRIVLDFDLLADAEKYFKKRWWTAWLGFLIDWIMKLLSGVIALVPSAILDSAQFLTPDGVHVDLGVQDLTFHQLLSGGKRGADDKRYLGHGPRRLVSSQAIRAEAKFKKQSFDLPACDVRSNWKQVNGPVDFLKFIWKTVVGCPMQAFAETMEFLFTPLRELIFKDLGQTLEDKLNAMAGKSIGDIREVLTHSFDQVVVDSHRLLAVHSPLRDKGAAGRSPYYFSTLCKAATDPEVACLFMEIFSDPNVLSGEGEVGLLVQQLGAKTHHRAMDEFPAARVSHFNEPSVRSCVLGDNPTGDPAYAQTQADLNGLSDFNEIDVGSRDIRTADGTNARLPLGWKSQCALFTDFKMAGSVTLRKTEIKLRPSARTQALINDAFTCRDVRDCSVTGDGRNSPFHVRATLAMCSLTADIWYRAINPANPAAPGPWGNLMMEADQANADARAQGLDRINTQIDGMMSKVAMTSPASAGQMDIHRNAMNEQLRGAEPGLTRLDGWFAGCLFMLRSAGYQTPRAYPEAVAPGPAPGDALPGVGGPVPVISPSASFPGP